MSDQQLSINDNLKIGIEAARAGQNARAQKHLMAVLKVEPDNVTALFWLAFVLPTPKDSLRLLERVLILDPTNERARAGIQWAKKRLQAEAIPPAPQPVVEPQPKPVAQAPESQPAIDLDPEHQGAALRKKLLSKEATKMAKKGPIAHRARRTFDISIVILAGLVSLLVVSLGLLAVIPSDALAAWWPGTAAPAEPSAPQPALAFVKPASDSASPAESLGATTKTVARTFASETDTIIMDLPKLAGIEAPVVSQADEGEPLSEAPIEGVLVEQSEREPLILSAAPSTLIGPELESAAAEPVSNLLLAHQPAYPGEKWIEVNVSTQQITAWEGDTPVFTFIGSTGLPNTPTVVGEFNIYWKLESTLMAGADYYLPDVPYTMYFYQGYALHGAYWHNNFGQPMSHGCVNLDIADAQTIFEWADPVIPPGHTQVVASADNPGTLVVVHQ